MAYEIAFTANISVDHSEEYINHCCWGGDQITKKLLPVVVSGYERMETGQEDWGWYIWMRRGRQRTHIDIYCDDRETKDFRIHLYGTRRIFLKLEFVDGEDIDAVKRVLLQEIVNWGEVQEVQKFTPDFMTELSDEEPGI